MFDQTFAYTDLPKIATLVFLELLLSADNAIILATITHPLPPQLRRKALYIGVASAFILRAAALFFVALLLKNLWLRLLGAIYLLYLCIRHFIKKKSDPFLPTPTRSLWKTVFAIELFDLAFALDSILAGVAFIYTTPHQTAYHPKLWIVYVGGMIGLLGVRYAASLFSTLMDSFPRLPTSAYLIVGWIGLKLALVSLDWTFPHYEAVFWIGLITLFLAGLRKAPKT